MSIFTKGGITIATDPNNILDYSGVGSSGWSGTIATLPGGAVLTWAGGVGAANSMSSFFASQLAKQRLYNTTRGNYALISTCFVGGLAITLTAKVPAGWQIGDVITTITPNLTGAPASFVDFEFDSGALLGAEKGFFFIFYRDTGAANVSLTIHPAFDIWSASQEQSIFTQVAGAQFISSLVLAVIRQNVFSVRWVASGAATARPIFRQIASA